VAAMGYSVYVDQNIIYIINKDIKDLEGLPTEEYFFKASLYSFDA
jgi:hypothetical protein